MINFSKSNVWQLGGGTSGKSCAEEFLKYDVALIGPGDLGPWPGPYPKDRTMRFIRQFVDEAKIGDIIMLRQGQSSIRAVGIIASDYQYLAQFEDVDGWDLQHARRVRWFPMAYDFGNPVFGANPPRFSGVGKSEVINYAMRFIQSPPQDWQSAKLRELPPQEQDMDPLPSYIVPFAGLAKDLIPLYWDPPRFGELPTEDELVGHFIIPLLKALGWPPELIGVKWRRVDIALFHRLPRNPENCHLVIEAKRYDTGFEFALRQAQGYLKGLGIERDVLVTDGIRYRLYAHKISFAPVAYANLSRLKTRACFLFENLKRC
jgi:hypothetical protein